MHDTSSNTTATCGDVCENTFDPRKVRAQEAKPIQTGSDAEFIAEYRRNLSMLNIKVQSDYTEMKRKYHSQSRRLDALEGLVPSIHMHHQQVDLVSRELRALKRIVTDLQIASEKQQQPLFERLLAYLSNVWLSNRV